MEERYCRVGNGIGMGRKEVIVWQVYGDIGCERVVQLLVRSWNSKVYIGRYKENNIDSTWI